MNWYAWRMSKSGTPWQINKAKIQLIHSPADCRYSLIHHFAWIFGHVYVHVDGDQCSEAVVCKKHCAQMYTLDEICLFAVYPILAYKEHMLMYPMFHINIYKRHVDYAIRVLIHTYLMFAMAFCVLTVPPFHSKQKSIMMMRTWWKPLSKSSIVTTWHWHVHFLMCMNQCIMHKVYCESKPCIFYKGKA